MYKLPLTSYDPPLFFFKVRTDLPPPPSPSLLRSPALPPPPPIQGDDIEKQEMYNERRLNTLIWRAWKVRGDAESLVQILV